MDYVEVNGRMSDGKTNRILRVDKEGRVISAEKITETFHPFGWGTLVLSGDSQYCTEYTTTAAVSTDEVVESVVMETALPGVIYELYASLTGSFAAASAATADVIYKWQARSEGRPDSDWTTMVTVTHTDISSTDTEETYAGYFGTANGGNRLPEGMDKVPLEARLVIQCGDASQGQGKTSNASYFTIIYMPD